MITIIRMGVLVYPAETVIKEMGRDDQCYSRNEQPVLILDKELFQHQENKACKKNGQGQEAMVVFAVAMPEGDGADHEGKPDHTDLKEKIVDDVYPE